MTPDGLWLCGGGATSGRLYLWELWSGRLARRWEGHFRGVTALCVDERGEHVISGGGDGLVRPWCLSIACDSERCRGPRDAFAPLYDDWSDHTFAGRWYRGPRRAVLVRLQRSDAVRPRIIWRAQGLPGVALRGAVVSGPRRARLVRVGRHGRGAHPPGRSGRLGARPDQARGALYQRCDLRRPRSKSRGRRRF